LLGLGEKHENRKDRSAKVRGGSGGGGGGTKKWFERIKHIWVWGEKKNNREKGGLPGPVRKKRTEG